MIRMKKLALPLLLLTLASSAANARDPVSDAMSACMNSATSTFMLEDNICLSRFGNATSPNVPELMKCKDYARVKYLNAQLNCQKIIG
jgi:hypothetical protein